MTRLLLLLTAGTACCRAFQSSSSSGMFVTKKTVVPLFQSVHVESSSSYMSAMEEEEESQIATTMEQTLLSPMTARALVLMAAAIYGTNFAAVKVLDESMPILVSATLRFGLAATVVSSMTGASPNKEATQGGMQVGVWYGLGYLSQAYALSAVDASKSAFFSALAVLVVPILDAVLRERRMNAAGIVSILCALGGVSLLQVGDHTQVVSASSSLADIACALQAFFFGIGYWQLEQVSSKYPNQSAQATAGQLMGVTALCGTALVGSGDVPTVSALTTWLSNGFLVETLVWTGLVSTALALYLETLAMMSISATEVTILMTSVSIWGSAFAFVTLHESLSKVGMVGGLLIVAGCVVSALGQSKEESPSVESFQSDDMLVLANMENTMEESLLR